MNRYVAAEGFYFEPNYVIPVSTKPTLQIARPEGTIRVNEPVSFALPSRPQRTVYGILGMIQLLSGTSSVYFSSLGPYLIVITERKLACRFLGHYIWKVTGSDILACGNGTNGLDAQQRADEDKFVELLKTFLASDWIYYSPTYDLTRSIQSEVTSRHEKSFLRSNLRFVVNRVIATPFLQVLEQRTDTRLEDFLVFCIEGCMCLVHGVIVIVVELQSLTIHQKKVAFGVISRRATGRVGRRCQ
jgi:hypothetical protein